jgi:hypothetical protein
LTPREALSNVYFNDIRTSKIELPSPSKVHIKIDEEHPINYETGQEEISFETLLSLLEEEDLLLKKYNVE